MLSFKQYVEKPGIITTPIHFKHIDARLDEALKPELPSSASEHYHGHLSRELGSLHDVSDEDKTYLHHYTTDNQNGVPYSKGLNVKLLGDKQHKFTDTETKMHSAILRNTHPADRELHLYSGVKEDFGALADRHGGVLDSPSHISGTTSQQVAINYADSHRTSPNAPLHIVHIHIKPGAHILHTHSFTEYPDEHEHILPAGMRLQYHSTTSHKNNFRDCKVHHFTVDNKHD